MRDDPQLGYVMAPSATVAFINWCLEKRLVADPVKAARLRQAVMRFGQ